MDYVDGSTLQKVFKNPEPLVLDRTSDKPSEETPEKDVEAAGLKFTTAKVRRRIIPHKFIVHIMLDVCCSSF